MSTKKKQKITVWNIQFEKVVIGKTPQDAIYALDKELCEAVERGDSFSFLQLGIITMIKKEQ